jgi:hypothetical protein
MQRHSAPVAAGADRLDPAVTVDLAATWVDYPHLDRWVCGPSPGTRVAGTCDLHPWLRVKLLGVETEERDFTGESDRSGYDHRLPISLVPILVENYMAASMGY